VDVLVLDLRMPGSSGLDVLRSLAAEPVSCKTVVLTATVSDDDAAEALRLGAMGLVLKESSPEALIECVRKVHDGERWIDRATMNRAFGSVVRRESAMSKIPKSPARRELEIVRLVAEGLRKPEIAQRLFVTEGTGQLHLHNVYEKLGVDGGWNCCCGSRAWDLFALTAQPTTSQAKHLSPVRLIFRERLTVSC
jgi:DNA-binding NarL/FixJ family response regulator